MYLVSTPELDSNGVSETFWNSLEPNVPKNTEENASIFHLPDETYPGLKSEEDLGFIETVNTGEFLRISYYYPFGVAEIFDESSGLFVGEESWRNVLLHKGIAGALERIILGKYTDCRYVRSSGPSVSRMRQERKYGLTHDFATTISGLTRTLCSPHFRIVQFPSWIKDPEILLLRQEKTS